MLIWSLCCHSSRHCGWPLAMAHASAAGACAALGSTRRSPIIARCCPLNPQGDRHQRMRRRRSRHPPLPHRDADHPPRRLGRGLPRPTPAQRRAHQPAGGHRRLLHPPAAGPPAAAVPGAARRGQPRVDAHLWVAVHALGAAVRVGVGRPTRRCGCGSRPTGW